MLLGEVISPWTVGRFSLAAASSVRELIRVAEFILRGLSVAELPGFFTALAEALGAMLAVGGAGGDPHPELLIARTEEARPHRWRRRTSC